MDFKSFFKNKLVITSLILIVLIIVFALLTRVSNIFFIFACLLTSALCVIIGTKFVLDIKKQENNNTKDLLPLTQEQISKIEKSEKFQKANLIIKSVMFYVFAIIFLVLIF